MAALLCGGFATAATAAPADLDAAFGTAGVATVSGDRYLSQSAPLLVGAGKIVVAGRERSADRAFLTRFTRAGVVDPGFDFTTAVPTALGRARSAVAPGGRVLLAGGGDCNGPIVLERYNADGSLDSSYGTGGRVTIDLSAYCAVPTSLVVQPDGKAVMTVVTERNGIHFTILRVGEKGLDPSFDGDGMARVNLGKVSIARDLALLGDGRMVIVGSVYEEGSWASNTALARLNANGSPDTTFDGDGKRTADLSSGGASDHAAGVVVDNAGRTIVTGPLNSDGYVARFTSTGALDNSFGSGGARIGGFTTGTGEKFTPADIAMDGSGRLVVGGTTRVGNTSPYNYRWTLARLTTAGTFDETFAGGRRDLAACNNTAGNGVSGVTVSAERIYVQGSCGQTGAVALARLFSGDALRSTLQLTVGNETQAAGRRRIALAKIDPTAALGNTEALSGRALRNSPLGRSPLGRSPLGRSPLGRSPLGRSPLGRSLLGRSPLGRSPLGRSPLGRSSLLSAIPLGRSSWEEVLEGHIDAPWQTLTLDDVFALDPLPQSVQELTLADIPLGRSPLADLSYAALLFGWTPLSALPAPENGWCAFLEGMPANCDAGYTLDDTTLMHLEAAGNDLTAYYREPISLRSTQFRTGDAAAVLSDIPLEDLASERTRLADVPASELQGAQTVGDVIERLPLPSLDDMTFGQLLVGLIPVADIPYERAPLGDILREADVRAANLQTVSSRLTVDCAQASDLRAAVSLPEGARYVKDSARVGSIVVPDPQFEAGRHVFALAGACAGVAEDLSTLTLTFDVEPGFLLGPVEYSAEVLTGSESVSAAAPARVDDSLDSPDDADGAQELTEDEFVTGHIAGAGDIDAYRFRLPEEGATVTFTLRVPRDSERSDEKIDPAADFDLFVHTPAQGVEISPLGRSGLRDSPLGRSPLGRSSVTDSSREPGIAPDVIAPDTVQDAPLGRSPLGRSPLGRSSVNRSDEPESATIEVSESQAGKDAYVRVSGFNGSYARRPYLLRAKITPAPPAPECEQRSLQGASAGAWPNEIPAGTESLILVNRRRFAARYGEADALALMDRLRSFATLVDGVVLPVESHPDAGSNPSLDVDGAAAAWDADACSPAAANLVVQRMANVVDAVAGKPGGGFRLDKLRHLMIVGTDEIVPQARLRDGAVLANEDEYAIDAQFGDRDSAVSGSLRRSFILSDDVIADFDPQEGSGRPVFVPDLAVGRVVETVAEITGQLDRFESSQGMLDPQTASVAGYDFLSDGSQAVANALSGIAPLGFNRIDEQWNASEAIAAMGDSRRQFGSYNAHYDHYRAQPAADYNGTSASLVHARQATPAAGSFLFNMGCHGGLNIPDVVVSLPGDEERLGDWPQLMSDRNVLYAGNTGYGYGDTEIVAYNERLAALFASNLASRQMTSAQAMMYAKQAYAAGMGIGDDYDAKALNQFSYYGPPMYRVSGGETARPALPEAPSGSGGLAAAPVGKLQFSFTEHPTDRGRFWTATGPGGIAVDPLAVQHRPVQPRYRRDVTTRSGAPVHGFVIDSLVTEEIDGVDPVLALPTIDLAAHEPEPGAINAVFPAVTQTVRSVQTPEGRRDYLDLVLGQYRDEDGERTQVLIRSLSGRSLSSYSDDWEPPVIDRVTADIVEGGVVFNVLASDDSAGGSVLYRTDTDAAWRKIELARVAPGRLGAAAALPAGTTRVFDGAVQVYDEAGNVGQAKNKVVGHFASLGSAETSFPRIVFSPEPPASGYYETAPTVTLEPGPSGAELEYSVDGGEYRAYGEPFTIPSPQEGTHVIRVRGSDGSEAAAVVAVDALNPVVSGLPAASPNEHGWYRGDVTVDFICADAASGIESCSPEQATITGEGRDLSATSIARDRAGHSASGTVGGINIDRTAPEIGGSAARAPEYSGAPKAWFKDSVRIRFACSDALSGVLSCPDDIELGAGEDQSVDGDASDRAGNEAETTVSGINVDDSDPAVAINSRPVYVLGDQLEGTVSDTFSGAASVTVRYEPRGLGTARTEEAVLSCSDGGLQRTCTWRAALPGIGSYDVVATARDRVGHVTATESQALTVTIR